VLFPGFPVVIGPGLDPSWMHGLNLAHAQHLTFGTDIVFTYGPLAYLGYPSPRSTNPLAVVLWNFSIYAASIYFLVRIVRLRLPSKNTITLLIAVSVWAAFKVAFGSAERIQIAFLLGAWFLIAEPSFRNMLPFILAGILAGISLLTKVNDGVINVAIYYVIWACSFWRDRNVNWRPILLGLLPPAAFCLLFLAANGPLTAVPNYIRSAVRIGGGYSEAMSFLGPSWQVALAIGAIVLLFLILTLKSREIPYRILIPVAVLCWASFKHCMVRQDGHAVPFHAELAAIAGFGLVTAASRARRNVLIAFVIVNIFTATKIARWETPDLFNNIANFLEVRPLPGDIARYLDLQESWQVLDFMTEAALSGKKADPTITKTVGNGSVDDLTWNVDFIAANHFRWNPRPVFQSYAAYEPQLDAMNARHLDRAGADYLSLIYEGVDGRHPFLDDVSTWREVFNHYNIAGGDFDLLLLSRRAGHRYSTPVSLTGVKQAYWGDDVRVPSVADNQLLVMKANITRSLWGMLRESVFRIDPAFLDVTYKSGAKAQFRITRPNLINGAIISDLPRTLAEMLPLFGYDVNKGRDRVASIRWTSPGRNQFGDRIGLSWSAMTLKEANVDTRPPLLHPDVSSFVPLWKPGDGIAGAAALRTQRHGDNLLLLPTNDDPQILLKASQNMARFNSLLIRAKFSVSDQIDFFFGQQVNGRGIAGYVPIDGQWVDIFVRVDQNPFWKGEAGGVLRFDPVTGRFRNSQIEIAGVWGSIQSLKKKSGDMSVYLSRIDGDLPR
jgi:hypothetical protein